MDFNRRSTDKNGTGNGFEEYKKLIMLKLEEHGNEIREHEQSHRLELEKIHSTLTEIRINQAVNTTKLYTFSGIVSAIIAGLIGILNRQLGGG